MLSEYIPISGPLKLPRPLDLKPPVPPNSSALPTLGLSMLLSPVMFLEPPLSFRPHYLDPRSSLHPCSSLSRPVKAHADPLSLLARQSWRRVGPAHASG